MKHITQLKPSIAKIASEMSKTYSDALNHINGNVTFRALPDSDIKEYLYPHKCPSLFRCICMLQD